MHKYFVYVRFVWLVVLLFLSRGAWAQFRTDSIFVLPQVSVTARMPQDIIPGKKLEGEQLRKMSTFSVADAIRYFSGVQIKDYGGLGGMKTVNIRSMGTNHMGVFYNGIQLGNAQNGQVDLGKFSLDNLEQIVLYNGQKSNIFQSAREFGSAGSIYLQTKRPSFLEGERHKLHVGLRAGSFMLAAPSLRWEVKLPRGFSMVASGEFISSDGKYPFRYRRVFEDGTIAYDTTAVRKNGDITAFRLEATLYKKLHEGEWDAHAYYYNSHRGLPGPIVKNVFEHGQRLFDEDFFVQTKLYKKISRYYHLKVNAKYSNDYTRYIDREWTSPLYVDNQYEQHDLYLSVANKLSPWRWLDLNFAVDGQYNALNANLVNFAFPRRFTLLTALAMEGNWRWLRVQASGLGTFVRERVDKSEAAPPKSIFTPAVFFSVRPFEDRAFYIQSFYKNIFRMPTFNDLYYTFIGNSVLDPEYVRQFNVGLSYTHDKALLGGLIESAHVQMDLYRNRITDKIVAVPAGNMFRWMMLNLGEVDIRGAEVNAKLSLVPLEGLKTDLNLTYTYQRALDVTSEKDKNYKHQIVYIPEHSGSLILSADYKSWGLNYSFIYTGTRYNAKYNDVNSELQPWYTSDLSLRKAIRLLDRYACRVSFDINNLLDQHYEVVLSYPMPGRNYRLTFNTSF